MCDYCSWIDHILKKIRPEIEVQKKRRRIYVNPVILVHGGAGRIPWKMRNRMMLDVKHAAIKSYSYLINAGSAVNAAERAVRYMESKPFFNCGKGGSLDMNDEIVMDAAIMTERDVGCVGAVRNIEHPITLAKKVLEETNHVLIVENGAQKFALDHGIPILQPNMLNVCESTTSNDFESVPCCTDDRYSKYEVLEEYKDCDSDYIVKQSIEGEGSCYLTSDSTDILGEPTILQVGAVGAVAYDRKKRLVSATSAAGELGKPIGLISATGAVIGCGICTDERGSVSVSGNDTSIYCYAPARRIIKKLWDGTPTEIAVCSVLQDLQTEVGKSDIGIVTVDAKGNPYVSFNCMHFPWAYCQNGNVYYGCVQNESYTEKVDVLERPLDCMCIDSSDEE